MLKIRIRKELWKTDHLGCPFGQKMTGFQNASCRDFYFVLHVFGRLFGSGGRGV